MRFDCSLQLNTGDQIPADGVMVTSHNLIIDESVMTGESLPVKKSEERPFMLSGCQVASSLQRLQSLC